MSRSATSRCTYRMSFTTGDDGQVTGEVTAIPRHFATTVNDDGSATIQPLCTPTPAAGITPAQRRAAKRALTRNDFAQEIQP